MSRLIHPRLLHTLQRDFFPQSCTIETVVKTQSTTGQEKNAWEAVSGWNAIPCRKAAAGGGERRMNNQVYLDATHTILLSGIFTGLTEEMHAVVDGEAYDILVVEPDSEGITTRLMVRFVR